MDNSILATALNWFNAGYAPVPTRLDGSKAPAVNWARYNLAPITEADVRRDFSLDTDGIGLVTGDASCNLEMLEVEQRGLEYLEQLEAIMIEHGAWELWQRIDNGLVDGSPSGGLHWHYRILDGPARPNTKLASRPPTADELKASPGITRVVLFETRGRGGFTVIAPSGGRTHPNGEAWICLRGDVSSVPIITVAERDQLYALVSLLDQTPPVEPKRSLALVDGPARPRVDNRPGDLFNQRATWGEILEPHGWTATRSFGANLVGWTRPGKSARDGISATTGRNDGDNLYVFSTSTLFEAERPYSKFGAYALLNHGGDFTDATKALARMGYGSNTMAVPAAQYVSEVQQVQGSQDVALVPSWPPSGQGQESTPTVLPVTRRLVLTPASSIQPLPVHWLWQDRIALGTLALLAGREGLGKSTMAYWWAAEITRGTLPGQFYGIPKSVLVCATEDSWEQTIVPRLISHGADLDRVFRVEVMNHEDIHIGLTLPLDLLAVEQAAAEKDAAAMVLDPLISRLGGLDTHIDAQVRQALEPMVELAYRARLSILGLIHHNKSGSGDPLQLVMGSKAFTSVARSVHTIIPDPDDDDGLIRLFGTPKNNLGRTDLPTLTFQISGFPIETSEGTAWTGHVQWGEDYNGNITDTMARSLDDGDTRTLISEATMWLEDYVTINGGQVASKDAKRDGNKAGFKDHLVMRARKKLGLAITSSGFPRQTYWEARQSMTVMTNDVTTVTNVTTVTTAPVVTQSPPSRITDTTVTTVTPSPHKSSSSNSYNSLNSPVGLSNDCDPIRPYKEIADNEGPAIPNVVPGSDLTPEEIQAKIRDAAHD